MAQNNKVRNISQNSSSPISKISFLIFGALAIYIIVLVFTYFNSKQIMGYEVQMGSLSISKTYTGFAIRDEEIITSPYTGYINYYVREGERVSVDDTVYSIDESGKLADLLNESELGETAYSDADLSDFRNTIIDYNRSFDKEDFQSVYDFKYDLEGDVIKLVNLNMFNTFSSIRQTSLGASVNLCSTGSKSGYVVYHTDGYEDITPELLTKEIFDTSKYEKHRINNNDLIEGGTAVGKIITDEAWSLVIPIEEERAQELQAEGYVEVKFIKTQENSWASVEILYHPDGCYAVLSFTNSCKTFCTDRFVEIELIINDEEGLKIPNSAITEKTFFIIPAEYMSKGGSNGNYGVTKETFDENGNVVYEFVETTVYNSTEEEFYVDNSNLEVGDYICKPDSLETTAVSRSGTLIGVYNMNKGYADFKQVTILYQNEEYAIVNSNTKYGLTVYDRIVLDAGSVSDDDFIYH